MGDAFGLGWFYLVPIRRKVVKENLRLAFPSLTNQELDRLARDNYRHYGKCLIEILLSLSWSPETYRKKVVIEGLENAERHYRAGRGGFFLTCHLGNWEVLVGSGASWGIPVDIVVKRAQNQTAEQLLKWYRNRLGVGVLIETGTAKDILRSISKGRFVGFILDQFMGPPIGLPVTFFGHQAGTTVSLALLTEKRDTPILPAYSYRDKKGILHTVIEPALKLPAFSEDKNTRLFEKTQYFNHIIEERVRMFPDQWLWLHRRWKAYRGEPRWLPAKLLAPTTALLMILLAGCSTPGTTPTGIALPPDPTVNVPTFQEAPPETISSNETDVAPAPAPAPAVVAPVKPAPVKKTKKKKGDKSPAAIHSPGDVKPMPPSNFFVVPSEKIPFEIGEQLEIELGWLALPAGRAIIEVRKGEPFNGRPTYHFWGNALSSKLVDAIYHIDNTIESFVDTAGFIPYKFLLHMVETHQNKETRVSFDHVSKKAFYWAKRVSKKWGDANDDRGDELVPQAKDLFSGIYFARTLNYKLNQTQTFYVYENGKNWQVELTPVANELIVSKVGAFQCWKIKVDVKLDNVLKPTGDIFMWLSDDSKKYLVKFDAKIKIGSLHGNLKSIRERQ